MVNEIHAAPPCWCLQYILIAEKANYFGGKFSCQ
nr:MAG TPA: hypothetical protein [Caudoviricetes sp.]